MARKGKPKKPKHTLKKALKALRPKKAKKPPIKVIKLPKLDPKKRKVVEKLKKEFKKEFNKEFKKVHGKATFTDASAPSVASVVAKLRKRRPIEEVADAEAIKAVARVNKHAYAFDPELLYAVGIDVNNGRILVKPVRIKVDPSEARLAEVERRLASAAKLYCCEERAARDLKRECQHPKWAVRRKRYCVGSEAGVMIMKYGRFCTKCGTAMRDQLAATA